MTKMQKITNGIKAKLVSIKGNLFKKDTFLIFEKALLNPLSAIDGSLILLLAFSNVMSLKIFLKHLNIILLKNKNWMTPELIDLFSQANRICQNKRDEK